MAIKPLALIPPLALAGFAALAFWGMQSGDETASNRAGKPAPDLPTLALEGYPALDPNLIGSGDVVLVNFWASWCPPCRAEHPKLMALQEEGLEIVGVNHKDKLDGALRMLDDMGNPFVAVPVDTKGRSAIEWGVTAVPETFILNGAGEVLYRFAGPLIGTDFDVRFKPELDAALASANKKQAD